MILPVKYNDEIIGYFEHKKDLPFDEIQKAFTLDNVTFLDSFTKKQILDEIKKSNIRDVSISFRI